MKFGSFPLDSALGVRLAHTVSLPGRKLRKGRILDAQDLEALRAAGVTDVAGASIAADEYDEDAAAAAGAELLGGDNIAVQPAARGRSNLKAAADGVLLVDGGAIDALNRVDEALTVGTLPPYTPVRKGQVVATVKTIPFAVARATLDGWKQATGAAPPLRVAPFRSLRAALLLCRSNATSDELLDKTAAVTRARLEALGSELAFERRCLHATDAVRDAIGQVVDEGAQMVLIVGASVSKDRGDTVPAAIVAAGGTIRHFGMPVEPGNMLLYGCLGAVPVLNLPGCARSRRTNGLDWLLQRLLAGLPVEGEDIMGMGVGGLIASGLEGGEDDIAAPPEPAVAARPPRISALVLAAGRSTRMGERNKLCCEVEGVPMVRRVVDATLASRCVQTLVVTGHDAEAVEGVVGDVPVSLVHNASYAEGIASSLRCGLRALPCDSDGAIILLGDMPRVSAAHIDALIAAFDPVAPAIVAPERDGRRGNPVLWPRGYFREILALQGDQGARGLLKRNAPNVTLVAVDDDAIFTDVDNPEALERLLAPAD